MVISSCIHSLYIYIYISVCVCVSASSDVHVIHTGVARAIPSTKFVETGATNLAEADANSGLLNHVYQPIWLCSVHFGLFTVHRVTYSAMFS